MRPSRVTRTRTSCGRIFPDFVREWRRCSNDRDVGWDSDQGLRLRPVSKHQEQKHLAAPVSDLEAVDLRLVPPRGSPTSFRNESCFGDESKRCESTHTPIASRDRNPVTARNLLRGQVLLVKRDQNPERVVVQKGLAVLVVE